MHTAGKLVSCLSFGVVREVLQHEIYCHFIRHESVSFHFVSVCFRHDVLVFPVLFGRGYLPDTNKDTTTTELSQALSRPIIKQSTKVPSRVRVNAREWESVGREAEGVEDETTLDASH